MSTQEFIEEFDVGKRLEEISRLYRCPFPEMARLSGANYRRFMYWRHNESAMPIYNLLNLAKALDFSLDFFFQRTENPSAHKVVSLPVKDIDALVRKTEELKKKTEIFRQEAIEEADKTANLLKAFYALREKYPALRIGAEDNRAD